MPFGLSPKISNRFAQISKYAETCQTSLTEALVCFVEYGLNCICPKVRSRGARAKFGEARGGIVELDFAPVLALSFCAELCIQGRGREPRMAEGAEGHFGVYLPTFFKGNAFVGFEASDWSCPALRFASAASRA